MRRARELAGLSVGQVARRVGCPVPADMRRAKGWLGALLETALGATAGSAPEPDFTAIGIELKTIPVRRNGRPTESTHVCTVPMFDNVGLSWANSLVRRKLAHVLWIPIENERGTILAERRIGTPLLWRPTSRQEAELQADWEELMELVVLGDTNQISAHRGAHLQIRPKAANASERVAGIDAEGRRGRALPLGFYLRPSFTRALLAEHYTRAR